MAFKKDPTDKNKFHKVFEMTFTAEELEDAKTLLCLNMLSHLDYNFKFGEDNQEDVFVEASLSHPEIIEALLAPIDSQALSVDYLYGQE